MKAVIIATGTTRNSEIEFEVYPRELLPLVDRPFIQHIVENLVEQGIVEFEFILSNQPEKFEKLLGDGTRWGSKFTFHLTREAKKPYRILQSIVKQDETVLLVHADRLLSAKITELETVDQTKPHIFYWRDENANDGEEDKWSGYAILRQNFLFNFAIHSTEAELAKLLLKKNFWGDALLETAKPLNVLSYKELIESQSLVLSKQIPLANFCGSEVENGIWISRNVSLHPSVKMVAPVFIGENCRVGENAEIGPNTVVGSNCLVDKNCIIENSIVSTGSFLGENLKISDSVVLKNKLVNTKLGTRLTVPDEFILGNLFDRGLKAWVTKSISQCFGILLLLAFAPIVLVTVLWLKLSGVNQVINYREVARLPVDESSYKLNTFNLLSFKSENETSQTFDWGTGDGREIFLRFLPALYNVARGEMRIVGVRPRTSAEIQNLPADWSELYLSSKPGLITEAFVHYGANPTTEELCAAESVYSVRAGFLYDLKLVNGFFKQSLNNLFVKTAETDLKISQNS